MTATRLFVNGKEIGSPLQYPLPNEGTSLVFESLRSYDGIIFRLKEHVNRLLESAKTIQLKLPKNADMLELELKSCLKAAGKKDAFLRISADETNTYVLVTERHRPPWIYEKGIELKTSVIRKNMPNAVPSEAKTNAFLANVMATQERIGEGVYDVILLDGNGFVTESTVWNLFMIKNGSLFTAATGILHGVTQEFVIECARLEQIPVLETNLMRHDLWNADEAFLTNTSGEIVPIRRLDARTIGAEIPGKITQKLMTCFQNELKKNLKQDDKGLER